MPRVERPEYLFQLLDTWRQRNGLKRECSNRIHVKPDMKNVSGFIFIWRLFLIILYNLIQKLFILFSGSYMPFEYSMAQNRGSKIGEQNVF